MDLVSTRALRTFVVLAEELHFGRAAQRLGVSQSTVSEQLRGLEDDLGVVLFERHTRGVTLSEAGKRLLEPAQRLVDDHERLVHLAREAVTVGPTVVLGALAGAIPLVARLADDAADAGITLVLRTVTWTEGVRSVLNGELTAMLGMLVEAVRVPALSTIQLARSEAVVVMASNHPLASAHRLRLDDLAGHRMLVPSGYLPVVERLLGPTARHLVFEEVPSVPHTTGELLAGGSVAVTLDWLHRWWRGFGLVDRRLDPPIEGSMGLVHRVSLAGSDMDAVERLSELIRSLLPPE